MPHQLAKKMTKNSTKLAALLGAMAITLTSFTQAATIIPSAPQVNAKGHILIDYTTGKVIAEGNADSLLAPASLTKMMTSYIIGVELNSGNIKSCLLYTSDAADE